MLPDSVSWGRGPDHPQVVFKPDTEGGHFEGVLGTSRIVGDRLAIDGFTAQEVSLLLGGETGIFSTRVSACVDVAGRYALRNCTAAILKGGLSATGLSGRTIVEVND